MYNGRDGVVTDDNGLIYMRARYYSPELRRFVNADIIAGEITEAITLNRYAYANGNPVSFVDPLGLSADNRGGLVKNAIKTTIANIGEKVKKSFYNFINSTLDYYVNGFKALWNSIEVDLGFGEGIGVQVGLGDVDAGVEFYRDFYIGMDDGKFISGQVVSANVSAGVVEVGNTFDHRYKTGQEEDFCRKCGMYINAKSIIHCEKTERDSSSNVEVLGLDGDGELSIGVSANLHVLYGGHINLSFNLTEYKDRLFENISTYLRNIFN